MIKDALIKLNPFEAGGGSRGPDREAAERALPHWALISLSLNKKTGSLDPVFL